MNNRFNRLTDQMDNPHFRRESMVNLIAGLLVVSIGSLWLTAFADRVVVPLINRAENQIQMPDLRLISFGEADSLCRTYNIELLPARIRQDDKVSAGLIIDQYPEVGATIKAGRRVEVVVSSSSELIACPDVIGKSPREASLIADSTGLWVNLNELGYRFSETDPEGVIIEQNPSPLTGLMRGTELKAIISLGPAPLNPSVPELIGLSIDNASLILRKQGLKLGQVQHYPDRRHPPGTIIEQSRRAGESTGTNEIVDVLISIEPLGSFVKDSLIIYEDTASFPKEDHD